MRFILLCFSILTSLHIAVFQKQEAACGEWTTYKSEQCIKIMDGSTLHTKNEAEAICHALACGNEQVPTLITIKTQEKQDFINKFLFDEEKVVDEVWLGLDLGKDGAFLWNDEANLSYTNWGNQKKSISEKQHLVDRNKKHRNVLDVGRVDIAGKCVGIHSGENGHPVGTWNRANCKVKKLVVCEKHPPTLLPSLQKELSDLKMEMERKKKAAKERITELQQETMKKLASAEETIDALRQKAEEYANAAKQDARQKIAAANQEISAIKDMTEKEYAAAIKELSMFVQTPVPEGFVYIELPNQHPPKIIWPQLNWVDVSNGFAGLFFRVVGGNASNFGTKQDDNTRRISVITNSLHSNLRNGIEIKIPDDGSLSDPVWTGTNYGYSLGVNKYIGMNFKMTTGEVRPQNKPVRVWERRG